MNVQDKPFMADKYLVDKLPAVIILDDDKIYMRCTGAIDVNQMAEILRG